MRKIVAGLFVSLDGVVESPDKWSMSYFTDDMGAIIGGLVAQSDTILLGRKTYEEFAAYWPTAPAGDDGMTTFMNNTPKYVVSSTLETAGWNNSTLIKTDAAGEIARLKQQPGANINIIGSGTLVASLLQNDLLDELHLLMHPLVVGKGKRLFEEDGHLKRLELFDSKIFPNGVLSLAYRPEAKPE